MNETVHIDQAGRLVLPKRVRKRFRLQGGDVLSLEVIGDSIQLRPRKATVLLKRINGVLVLLSETPLAEGQDLVSESRDERIDEIARSVNKDE